MGQHDPALVRFGIHPVVVELADLPGHPARAIARRAKAKTELWLAEKLAGARVPNARQRSCEIMLLTEGAMALTLIYGGSQLYRRRGAGPPNNSSGKDKTDYSL